MDSVLRREAFSEFILRIWAKYLSFKMLRKIFWVTSYGPEKIVGNFVWPRIRKLTKLQKIKLVFTIKPPKNTLIKRLI
jgi:hypothetical protein